VRDVVRVLARALVERPDRVRVEEFDEDGTIVVELEVAPDDRGRVIGRKGRTAQAMRTLAGAIARKQGLEFDLDILD
jgi:predicted RNA-binding protein YlqC (UPF0109 family)